MTSSGTASASPLDTPPPAERHDVFDVQQLTYGTALQSVVAAEETEHRVRVGDRVLIPAATLHGVSTDDGPLRFLSMQSPPILDEEAGTYDMEPRG